MKRIFSALLALMILIIMLLSLTGCVSALLVSLFGSSDSDTASEQVRQEPDTEIYNTEVENAIYAEIPDAPFAEKPAESVTEGENIAEMIYQRAYYDVLSTDGAMCTVQVTAPDMQVIYWDAFDQATQSYSGADAEASAEMEAILMNIIFTQLETGNYPTRQTTLDLELINGQPQLTYEFADAMYGGMLTVWEQLMTAYEEG